jgi:hypothetical protein
MRSRIFGMAKSDRSKDQEIDLRPDGWERFRAAVHDMAKAGPQHRMRAAKASEGNAKPKQGKSPLKRMDKT